MASSPPGGGWLPSAETLKTVGHGLLDVAGLIPIIGEPADIINAAWLASEGNYLDAGLSLISCVPIIGDAIGKGGKVAKALGGKALGKVADLVRTMDFEKTLGKLLSDPRLAPYAKPIVDALNKWRDDLVEKFPACKPGGAAPCPGGKPKPPAPGGFKTHGWVGNPLESEVGRDMVASLEKNGLSRPAAIAKAQELMESGTALPQKILIEQGEKLFKLSPGGASPHTPYWLSASEIDKLRGLTNEQIASKLGLPLSSLPKDGKAFILQEIVAKEPVEIFRSVIAPASEGAYSAVGGGIQSLVTNRGAFSPPSLPKGF